MNTEQKIKSLSQLDRIEYRQREKEINKNNNDSFGISSLKTILIIILIIMISTIFLSELLGKELALEFFKKITSAIVLPIKALLILSIIGDVAFLIINYKKNKKLDEEYFGKKEKRK